MSAIIAIDGPAGSGKSSVSKEIARRLGFGYLDTGGAYRLVTLACIRAGVDLDSEAAVVAVLGGLAQQPSTDPDDQRFFLSGTDVTADIRTEAVSAEVSRIARHQGVREALNGLFREIARECPYPAIVIEGRDITTVVAPDAALRLLLTADEEVRIARREKELGGLDASALAARDKKDSAVVDFLSPAEGVVLVDSTNLDFEHTVREVMGHISLALPGSQGGEQ